jgi:hypothetical protein
VMYYCYTYDSAKLELLLRMCSKFTRIFFRTQAVESVLVLALLQLLVSVVLDLCLVQGKPEHVQ